MHEYICAHGMVCVWRLEAWVLSFHLLRVPEIKLTLISLCGTCLYPLSHPAIPTVVFI